MKASLFADPDYCSDCRRRVLGEEFLTQINPPGGYGRMQVLVCDDCMDCGRWDYWRNKHWPNWPHERK